MINIKAKDKIILIALLNLASNAIKYGGMTNQDLLEVFSLENKELYDNLEPIQNEKFVKELKNILKLYILKLKGDENKNERAGATLES